MKQVLYKNDAREKLLAGVNKIAKAVKITLGPSGKNVLIRNIGERSSFATKDGVTVAGNIASDDIFEMQAIELMQDIANQADNSAGDGTTTATILAEALFQLGCEQIDGLNPIDFKIGIQAGVDNVVKWLHDKAIHVQDDKEMLRRVAMIASNNDEIISDVVLKAFEVAGDQGVVNIKRSRTAKTYLTTIDGVNLDCGYRSIYYVNDHKAQIVDFAEAYVYMTNERITAVTDNLNEVLMHCSKEQTPLLILCNDIDEIVSDTLIDAVRNNALSVCVCKAPEFGTEQIEMFRDLGAIFGKEAFLEKELSFNNLEKGTVMDYLPLVEGVIATKDRLSIKGPIVSDERYEEITKAKENRSDYLREQLEEQTTTYEKAKLQMRISRLVHGIAYINIGASSEIEYVEKQHRIQDSLYAIKSAYEEGIIPGGGYALNNFKYKGKLPVNKSMRAGMETLFAVLDIPKKQILENVGLELTEEQDSKAKENWNYGFNARTMLCGDLIEMGVIDPVKVTRVALENAANIIGMLLTTDCVVVEDKVYQSNSYGLDQN